MQTYPVQFFQFFLYSLIVLQLNNSFLYLCSFHFLFQAITGLSYNGDIRNWFAENPHKVQNIVEGNYANFQSLYKEILHNCPLIQADPLNEGVYHQTLSIENLAWITSRLPASLHPFIREQLAFSTPCGDINTLSTQELQTVYQRRLECLFDRQKENCNVLEAKAAIAKGIQNGVRHTVFKSSVDQALRGTASFGVLHSVQYFAKKVKKFLK